MKANQGQALIEVVAFLMALILMIVCFLGFTKWFLVKQKLLSATRQGAMLYSSGRMSERDVKRHLRRYLTTGSPALVEGRLSIQVGHRIGFQDVLDQFDIVKVRYTSQSPWYQYTHLNPTLEEKCIIKHAATYGPDVQPLYGPAVSWWTGSIVRD